LPEPIATILSIPPAKRTTFQLMEISNYYRTIDTDLIRRKQVLTDYSPPGDKRLQGAQDLAWALINTPEFIFNH